MYITGRGMFVNIDGEKITKNTGIKVVIRIPETIRGDFMQQKINRIYNILKPPNNMF